MLHPSHPHHLPIATPSVDAYSRPVHLTTDLEDGYAYEELRRPFRGLTFGAWIDHLPEDGWHRWYTFTSTPSHQIAEENGDGGERTLPAARWEALTATRRAMVTLEAGAHSPHLEAARVYASDTAVCPWNTGTHH